MDNRKKILADLLKEAELAKFAQQAMEKIEEDPAKGEQIAEEVFDKFLNEMSFDSIE